MFNDYQNFKNYQIIVIGFNSSIKIKSQSQLKLIYIRHEFTE